MRNPMRLIPGGKRLLLIALPILLGVGAVAGTYLYKSSLPTAVISAQPPPANVSLELQPAPGLLVHVVGAVVHPGLYRMKRGDRVYDAIAAAGGLTASADMTRLPNLAGRLKDGEQVKVAFAKGNSTTTVIRTNLNSATIEELMVVPGFSEALAQEVIDYRVNFGGFQTSRELVEILGMSEADYVIARRYLTL
jgi:competence protein ComEA